VVGGVGEVVVGGAEGLYRIHPGLPDSIVSERKDRVKAVIQNYGYPSPDKRITY
jgi:predicted ATPase with chaperone activity